MSHNLSTFWSKDNSQEPNYLKEKFEQWWEDRPGFFAPYKNNNDFFETLTDPFVIPLTHGFISCFIAAATVCAAGVCIASLFVSAVAKAFGQSEFSNSAFELAVMSKAIAEVWLIQSVVIAFSAVLSLPLALTNLATRTATSIVDPIAGCLSAADDCLPTEESTYQTSC